MVARKTHFILCIKNFEGTVISIKRLLIILLVSLILLLNGCAKGNTQNSSNISVANSSKVASNITVSSGISSVLTATKNPNAKMVVTPIAKSKDKFGVTSSYWVTLTNDSVLCFDNNKTLMLIDTNTFNVINEYDFETKEMVVHLKNTNNGILFLSETSAYLFDNNLKFKQKVSVNDIDDISSDLKQVVYTNEIGIYISNIAKTQPKLIAKHENPNPSDDMEGKCFKYPQFVYEDNKILFEGIGYEWVYAVFLYDIKTEEQNKFDMINSTMFANDISDINLVCLAGNEKFDIRIINFNTKDFQILKIDFPMDPSYFYSNGKVLVSTEENSIIGTSVKEIYKLDLKTKKYTTTKIGTDDYAFTIEAVLPDDTVIISDSEYFYRIKLD